MEIKDLMNPSVVTIEPTASAALAARLRAALRKPLQR